MELICLHKCSQHYLIRSIKIIASNPHISCESNARASAIKPILQAMLLPSTQLKGEHKHSGCVNKRGQVLIALHILAASRLCNTFARNIACND